MGEAESYSRCDAHVADPTRTKPRLDSLPKGGDPAGSASEDYLVYVPWSDLSVPEGPVDDLKDLVEVIGDRYVEVVSTDLLLNVDACVRSEQFHGRHGGPAEFDLGFLDCLTQRIRLTVFDYAFQDPETASGIPMHIGG